MLDLGGDPQQEDRVVAAVELRRHDHLSGRVQDQTARTGRPNGPGELRQGLIENDTFGPDRGASSRFRRDADQDWAEVPTDPGAHESEPSGGGK
jgi:hypothetical protein